MNETKKDCPECDTVDSLQKLPSLFSLQNTREEDKKTGEIVKAAIRDFQEDLNEQKNNLKNGCYEVDE